MLYRGAEADVTLGRWQGVEAVFKTRKPLPYRLPDLDGAIRKQRTLHEADMIHEAKDAGVRVPYLFDIDVPGTTLVMEYVKGGRLRDLVNSMDAKSVRSVFHQFGAVAGSLHAGGMMHGDLTTANALLRDGSLVFLDFGLSYRTMKLEDHAVDLRLIKETLVGAHPLVSEPALAALFQGYSTVVGQSRSKAVMRQLRTIERRGRYARMD